jgi:hypothetical protein
LLFWLLVLLVLVLMRLQPWLLQGSVLAEVAAWMTAWMLCCAAGLLV